jgi:alkaline phosphatase D
VDPAVTGDLNLDLQIALDDQFTQIIYLTVESNRRSIQDDAAGAALASLLAEAAFDRCVKVKIAGLQPSTVYYYRFYYYNGDKCYVSRVGRTKTAPAEDEDVPVRFAYVSCQDYIGRYYNSHVALAQEELDFFVHLGDYIYETTGDPSFQTGSETRKVTFTDTAGAIEFMTEEGDSYYAARSLSNYRELYRTYRSDPALQAVHERFPMIAVWDDHEYSNDCYGATANYFSGQQDENDVDRRKAANKAWFEYMPVDYTAGDDYQYDEAAEYPMDIAIHRDFKFGMHLHLVMTDLRTYRADHLIPEDAFPGKVAATEEALVAGLGMVPAVAMPYVDIDDPAYASQKQELTAAADALGYDPANVAGNLSVAFINTIVQPANAIDPMTAGLKRGISYLDVGKIGYYTSIGSRYFIIKDTFDVLSQLAYTETMGASEEVMGSAQEAWFFETIEGSDRTWKVWGTEYCLVQLAIDLTNQPVPDAFKNRYYMNCDAWDGSRNRRSAIIDRLSAAGLTNVVAVTGDIHAFYAGTPMVNGDLTKKVVEFVGSSVSSKTFKEELESQVAADPVLSQVPEAALLAGLIDSLLLNASTMPNPHLGFANSGSNGFCVAEVSADELVVTMHQIASDKVLEDFTGREAELAPLITKSQFKTVAGERELYRFDEESMAWQKWDPATVSWV